MVKLTTYNSKAEGTSHYFFNKQKAEEFTKSFYYIIKDYKIKQINFLKYIKTFLTNIYLKR